MRTIAMSAPDITDAEITAVTEVLSSPTLSMGPATRSFEEAIASFVGARHGIAVSSGTAGLHMCLVEAGVAHNDLVLTTPFSFIASANAALYVGATPVFVDVDGTGNLTDDLLSGAVSDLLEGGTKADQWLPPAARSGPPPGTLKAVLPVHAFGRPASLPASFSLAEAGGVAIIEDACEALGASVDGRFAGTAGRHGVFAFYPNKQMTTGEGGMIVTDDDEANATLRSLRNQGRDVFDEWLQHSRLGFNYRMDELSAALGVAQARRLPELLAKRAAVAEAYKTRLHGHELLTTPAPVPPHSTMSWFCYVVTLDRRVDRTLLMKLLSDRGVPSRPYFLPIHLQPFYRDRFGYERGQFPVAESLGDRCLALPFSGVMREEDVDYVVESLVDALPRGIV